MKRMFVFMLAVMMTASLSACGGSSSETTAAETTAAETTAEETTMAAEETEAEAEVANPWGDYSTLEEAEAAAGFDLTFGTEIGGAYTAKEFRAMEGMLEITYYAGDSTEPEDTWVIRQATLTTDDISGDENEYSHDFTVDDAGVTEVRLRGTKDFLSVCTFNYGDYSYAIYPGSMDYTETFAVIGEMTGVAPTTYTMDDVEASGEEGAPVMDDDRRIDIDPIDALEIAGRYTGMEYGDLELSMYTSTDDNYVGVMELSDQEGSTVYAGELQAIADNYYGLADEDVTISVYTEGGSYCLDLYVDGEHADYFTMEEHYES